MVLGLDDKALALTQNVAGKAIPSLGSMVHIYVRSSAGFSLAGLLLYLPENKPPFPKAPTATRQLNLNERLFAGLLPPGRGAAIR